MCLYVQRKFYTPELKEFIAKLTTPRQHGGGVLEVAPGSPTEVSEVERLPVLTCMSSDEQVCTCLFIFYMSHHICRHNS